MKEWDEFLPHYVLEEDGTPVPCPDVQTWFRRTEEMLQRGTNIIKQSQPYPNLFISTVFLPINHDFAFKGKPVLFETMIFGLVARYLRRCSTRAEAIELHKEMHKSCDLITVLCDLLSYLIQEFLSGGREFKDPSHLYEEM